MYVCMYEKLVNKNINIFIKINILFQLKRVIKRKKRIRKTNKR